MSAEIVSFKKAKSKRLKQKSSSLCKNGHHKWLINQKKQFDSQEGKLVTIYVCQRCGKQKVESH